MNMSAAGASTQGRHRAHHRIAAVAIGVGALLGFADLASARPIHDGAPPVLRRAPAVTNWTEVADLLPVSMVHERAALLAADPGAESGRLVFVSPERPAIDSATQSYIARGRAAQEEAARGATTDRVTSRVERLDAKDHPRYGGSSARVERPDTKDHPLYGPSQGRLVKMPIFRS